MLDPLEARTHHHEQDVHGDVMGRQMQDSLLSFVRCALFGPLQVGVRVGMCVGCGCWVQCVGVGVAEVGVRVGLCVGCGC